MKEKERSHGALSREEGPDGEESTSKRLGAGDVWDGQRDWQGWSKVSEGEAGRRQEELMHQSGKSFQSIAWTSALSLRGKVLGVH